jgi:hypothetical protein
MKFVKSAWRLCLVVALTMSSAHLVAQGVLRAKPGGAERIAGRPVDFYLSHKGIDPNSKLLYEGKWEASDDDHTFAMLDSVMTRNVETRPFYFYLFNRVMKIADGALAEYVGMICARYFHQYPCEFMAMQADATYDVDVSRWAEFIALELYLSESFKKYSAELKTKDCSSKELTSFLKDIERIITEENAH